VRLANINIDLRVQNVQENVVLGAILGADVAESIIV
jgi:hypothetical protein